MSQDDSAATPDRRDIEATLENTRIRIDHTLELLEDKCRPSVLFDQAWRYARAKSEDGTTSRLQDAIVRNPLPVALMGAGLAWLLVSGSEGSVARPDSPLAEATTGDSQTKNAVNSHRDSRPAGAESAAPGTTAPAATHAKPESAQAGHGSRPDEYRHKAKPKSGDPAKTASANSRPGGR